MATKNFNFETSLKELNSIVEEMERGDLTLENALKSFEKGIKLIRECRNALENAEQKVQILTSKDGTAKLEPYQES